MWLVLSRLPQAVPQTQKGRCGACMTFCPSYSNFSVFQRFQRHHCVQLAAEDAERRRKEDVMLA
jgi:heterodisulfide reductase subunit C